MKRFPEDNVLKLVYSIGKKARALQQYDKLLEFADCEKLYPNFVMLGAALGRFEARQPEFHPFLARPLDFFAKHGENLLTIMCEILC